MSKENYSTFRNLLRGAICDRTQAQFAQESGISAEHLSRMLNQDTIHRPNNGTLIKIASAARNGVTLQDLKDALDRDDGSSRPIGPVKERQARKDFAPDFHEQAEHTMELLNQVLKDQASYPVIVGSVPEYIERCIACVQETGGRDALPIAWEMGVPRPNFGCFLPSAKLWQPVMLSMSGNQEAAESRLMAYFDELPCSDGTTRYIMHGLTCAVEATNDQYGFSKQDLERAGKILDGELPYPEGLSKPELEPEGQDLSEDAAREMYQMALCSSLPYSLHFQPLSLFAEKYYGKGATPEERLLGQIFGEQARWQETLPGFGFVIDKIPDALPEFLDKHKKYVLDAYEPDGSNGAPGELAKLTQILADNKDPEQLAHALHVFEYQDPGMLDDAGWPSAVATIMRTETGFNYQYHAPATPEEQAGNPSLSKHGCIMLDADLEDYIQREAMVLATCRYARALGIKKFGDLLFTHMHMEFRKPMTYVVKEPSHDDGDGLDVQGREPSFIDFSRNDDASKPREAGRYLVKLKDGRILELFWIPQPGVWVRAHKEWSTMVAQFDPDKMLDPEPESDSESGSGPEPGSESPS